MFDNTPIKKFVVLSMLGVAAVSFLLAYFLSAKPLHESKLHFEHPLRIDGSIELRVLQSSDSKMFFDLIESQRGFLNHWDTSMAEGFETLESTQQELTSSVRSTNRTRIGIWYKNKLVGEIFVYTVAEQPVPRLGLGYFIAEEYQGKGIMTKSCQGLIKHLFDNTHTLQILANAGDHNSKSVSLLKRLGFKPIDKKELSIEYLDSFRELEIRDGISISFYCLDKSEF